MSTNTKNNKSICVYPWTHSYLGSRYDRRLCCVANPIDSMEKTTDDEFWNSEYMKTVRKKMIRGRRIKDCTACYGFEDSGISSLRQESEQNTDFDYLIEHTTEDGETDLLPNYYDYRTIHCNLQCVSCGDLYSSTHIKLNRKLFRKSNKGEFKPDRVFETSMSDEINRAITEKRLENLYWAGGEPMISKVHWDVIEYIAELRDDLDYEDYVNSIKMHYNTNLTHLYWKGQHIPTLLAPNQPLIHPSIDGTHETMEYTRDGASWDLIEKNWNEYHDILNQNDGFGIATVLSAPVIFDIDRWFDYFEPYNPWLHNHKFFAALQAYPYHNNSAAMDIRYYPQYIFDRVVQHAIKRFEKSKLRNSEKSVQILKSYIKDKKKFTNIFEVEKNIKIMKALTLNRDKFMVAGRSYGELLSIIDEEVFDWYESIEPDPDPYG